MSSRSRILKTLASSTSIHTVPSSLFWAEENETFKAHIRTQSINIFRSLWPFSPLLTWTSWRTWEHWKAGECSSSSGTVPWVLLAGEGYLRWVGVQEEVGVHLGEEVGEVEEASCPQGEGVAGELGPYLQKLAWVEEAGDHQVDPGRGEGLQEQQLPVSARGM